MKIRFQADNDLNRTIVRGVVRRRPLVDFRSEPINNVDDLTVLHLAAQDGRILVSHDISTMPEAFVQYRQGGHSPGVLLVPQLWPLAETIEQLVMIWEYRECPECR